MTMKPLGNTPLEESLCCAVPWESPLQFPTEIFRHFKTYASSRLNAPTFPVTWAERHNNGIWLVQMPWSTEQ